MRQTVEQVRRVVLQHEHTDERDHAGDDGATDRAPPERHDQLLPAAALGVGGEIDGREERAHHHRHHAAEHRRGVQPAAQRVAGLLARGNAPRRDPTHHRAEHERCEHR